MSRREPDVLLEDIRMALDKIARYTAGLDEAEFLQDERTVDAVVRNLEIIGEATKQLPIEFRAQHPGISWGQMAGLRNRIVHDYAGVDLALVWQIVTTSLLELARRIAELK